MPPFVDNMDEPLGQTVFMSRDIEVSESAVDQYFHEHSAGDPDSPIRVDSPPRESFYTDDDMDGLRDLTGFLNGDQEVNNGQEEPQAERANYQGLASQTPPSTKKSPMKTPKSTGRGRPRGSAAAKAPSNTLAKGSRASARVQEMAMRPEPARSVPAAAASKKRGRPTGTGVSRPLKRNKTSNKAEFEVEAILDSQIDADTFEHVYLVKWKGYNAGENTWEPKENLGGCIDLIHRFDLAQQSKQRKQSAEETRKSKAAAAVARSKARAKREASKADKTLKPKGKPAKRGRKPKEAKGRSKRS